MVAARNFVLFCGERTLDSVHLSGFFDLLVAHGVMYLPSLNKFERIVLEYDTFSLARAYLRQETWKRVPLFQALYRTGISLLSEPRDKSTRYSIWLRMVIKLCHSPITLFQSGIFTSYL